VRLSRWDTGKRNEVEGSATADRKESLFSRVRSFLGSKVTPVMYAASSVLTASAQLIAGFIVIKWIAPEELGLWQSVRLAQVYAFLLLLGINNGLGRELPYFLGKGDKEFAQKLASTAFSCATIANLLVTVIGVGCAIFFAGQGSSVIWAILAVTIQIVLAFYQQIFVVTFRSNEAFNKLSVLQFIEAVLSLLTIPIVYYFHYEGMLARTVLVASVVSALTYYYRPMRVPMKIDWPALTLLFKTGIRIFTLDYIKNSAGTLDRVVLLKLGGFREVGVYQLAGIALQTLIVLPKSLSSYLYPRMTFRFGQTGDSLALWKSGIRFVYVATGLTLVAAAVAWFALPYLVPVFAPKYAGGMSAARIILIAGVLEAVTIISNILLSMKAWPLITAYQLGSAAFYVIGPIGGCLVLGASMEGVAWGVAAGALFRSIFSVYLAFSATHRPQPQVSGVLAT
jgi:O-antigen/teichoic acid export membrane protein